MLSVPSHLSQSTPSLTISETDSLYIAVTTLHHELKSYAPEILPTSTTHPINSNNRDHASPKNPAKRYSTTRAKHPLSTGQTEASAVTVTSQITVPDGNSEKIPAVSDEIPASTLPHRQFNYGANQVKGEVEEDEKITIDRRKREEGIVGEADISVEYDSASESKALRERIFGERTLGGQTGIDEAEGWHDLTSLTLSNRRDVSANRAGIDVDRIQHDLTLGEVDHNTQMLSLLTSTATRRSKGAIDHKRDESFSSSIQSYDSVFTDTELSNSQQLGGNRYIQTGQESTDHGVTMGAGKTTERLNRDPRLSNEATVTVNDVDSGKNEDKRNSKDSGYGSRLNTVDLPSPSHSSSLKSSPKSQPSETKMEQESVDNTTPDAEDDSLKILPLANSPVNINKSYCQFYFFDDAQSTVMEVMHSKSTIVEKRSRQGKYPSQPLLPHIDHSKTLLNQLTIKSIQAIKSASCSSLDRLSLTSSLEEYASNLAKGGEESTEAGLQRGRLLSVTRFETLTTDLESPQCATVVTVSGPPPEAKEKKQLKHLLSRFHFGRRKARSEVIKSGDAGMIAVSGGGVKLRKKKGGASRSERQRKVVSDDLTHKVNFTIGGVGPKIVEPTQPTKITEKQLKTKSPTPLPKPQKILKRSKTPEVFTRKGSTRDMDSVQEREICLSAEHASPWNRTYLVRENHIAPLSAELSHSVDGGLQLRHNVGKIKKLTQPSQSTTNLDLSCKSKTETHVGLRVSQSVNDLGHPVLVGGSREFLRDEHPKEGFLWRVLGRASQRWPAMIHIVPILTNESGLSGFGVRKGQQIRALYRVSGQVIVETETNHLACIPYECCRVSRKYYGQESQLTQLSYTQLYLPIPDNLASFTKNSSSSPCSSSTRSTTPRNICINTPIEMVAIQDNYDRLPVGEINVEAGDKLRILFCDEERVFAVKENGEAGLVARNFCRLTRKSEKTYQKWVELTRSTFQSDYPVKFGEPPPSFLFDGTLSEIKYTVRSKPNTPEAQRKNRVKVKSLQIDSRSGRPRIAENPVDSSHNNTVASQKQYRPLPPTPQRKRKDKTPISPLTKSGLRSPMSPARKVLEPLSPTLAGHSMTSPTSRPFPSSPPPPPSGTLSPHLPSSPPPPPYSRPSLSSPIERTVGAAIKPPSPVLKTQEGGRKPSHLSTATKIWQPFSYSGKLMTVVRNYSLHAKGEESSIRKGLRVRVVNSSPDGRTLRVATNTGTQFDIPVSHLCLSRKISEPALLGYETTKFRGHQAVFVSNSMPLKNSPPLSPRQQLPLSAPQSPRSNLPLECGKIMTVIRNFVPSPDNPMVTIRRGLRVKVLGGHDNIVKVITKSGTTFNIPRSHLRLAHKNSDASTFGLEEKQAGIAPPTQRNTREDFTVEDGQGNVSPNTNIPSSGTSIQQAHPPASPVSQAVVGSPSNQTNGTQQGLNGAQSLRGCRVNSTGSQVFELC